MPSRWWCLPSCVVEGWVARFWAGGGVAAVVAVTGLSLVVAMVWPWDCGAFVVVVFFFAACAIGTAAALCGLGLGAAFAGATAALRFGALTGNGLRASAVSACPV